MLAILTQTIELAWLIGKGVLFLVVIWFILSQLAIPKILDMPIFPLFRNEKKK